MNTAWFLNWSIIFFLFLILSQFSPFSEKVDWLLPPCAPPWAGSQPQPRNACALDRESNPWPLCALAHSLTTENQQPGPTDHFQWECQFSLPTRYYTPVKSLYGSWLDHGGLEEVGGRGSSFHMGQVLSVRETSGCTMTANRCVRCSALGLRAPRHMSSPY